MAGNGPEVQEEMIGRERQSRDQNFSHKTLNLSTASNIAAC